MQIKESLILNLKTFKNKLDKSSLSNAIFYGSMNGGKRIRPFLVMESAKIAKFHQMMPLS